MELSSLDSSSSSSVRSVILCSSDLALLEAVLLVLALVLPLGASANREVIKPDQDKCSLPDERLVENSSRYNTGIVNRKLVTIFNQTTL